jgi:hypothetical protein
VFQQVPMLDAKEMQTVQKDAKDPDFRLKPGSTSVDKRAVISDVTDGHSGNRSDPNALESGRPLPHLGGRVTDQYRPRIIENQYEQNS